MNVTVLLTTIKAPFNIGSGVILSVIDSETVNERKVYVLTAKHCLYTLSGLKTAGQKTPADFVNNTFCNSIQIGYKPTAWLGAPTATAPVSVVNFLGDVCNDAKWDYDLVIFESTDATFFTHARANCCVPADPLVRKDYKKVLVVDQAKGCFALNTKMFELFQLGYGIGKDPSIATTHEYTDYGGKFQSKISSPKATVPTDTFEIVKNVKGKDWPTTTQIFEMNADVTSSTAPGDSGGPLFCRPVKPDKNTTYLASKDKFFLVGITSGMNFETDAELKKDNAKLPSDKIIRNNGVTYIGDVFDEIVK